MIIDFRKTVKMLYILSLTTSLVQGAQLTPFWAISNILMPPSFWHKFSKLIT